MAAVISALFHLLDLKSNNLGGTHELRHRADMVKEAVRVGTQGSLKVKLERTLKKMQEEWVAKTPGSWRPYVVCCLELMVDESGAEHVLVDVERIERAKRTMRISTEAVKRIQTLADQRKPQSVLKQLLKNKSTTASATAIVSAQGSARRSETWLAPVEQAWAS